MIVAVEDLKVADLIAAMHAVWGANGAVCRAAANSDLVWNRTSEVMDDLAWQLAERVGHRPADGTPVTYRFGRVGVTVRVCTEETSFRSVRRKVYWCLENYHA